MPKYLFVFVFGLVLGAAIAAVALSTPVEDGAEPESDEPEVRVGPSPTPPDPAYSGTSYGAYLDPSLDDGELASYLEEASFDHNWSTVGAVARALRERPTKPADATSPSTSGGSSSRAPARNLARPRDLLRLEQLMWRRSLDDAPGEHLQAALRLESETERAQELLALARTRDPSGLTALLVARHGGEAGLEALQTVFTEPDAGLAADAGIGLAAAGGAGQQFLVRTLSEDPDPTRRARAAQALAYAESLLREQEPLASLIAAARADADERVRGVALEVLGQTDLSSSVAARSVVLSALADASTPAALREPALSGLLAQEAVTRSLPTDLLRGLEAGLAEAPAALRANWIELLGRCGDGDTLEVLEAARTASPADSTEREQLEQAITRVRARELLR